MKIERDWWKDFFNETYLVTDARSVCNPVLTRREVDLLENMLGLDRSDRILDVCGGQGRHSLELARRGYRDLTVVDFSNYLVRLGRKTAKTDNLQVKFVRRDARSSGLKAGGYSAAFIMANSFGYFVDEKENLGILKEVFRLLKRGGRLLLDLTDADYAKKNLKPLSWHAADGDTIVCRQREIESDVVKAREIVLSKTKGLIRDGYYCERMYSKTRISRLLKRAGFDGLSVRKKITLHTHSKDYGFLTSRMIVTAAKA